MVGVFLIEIKILIKKGLPRFFLIFFCEEVGLKKSSGLDFD